VCWKAELADDNRATPQAGLQEAEGDGRRCPGFVRPLRVRSQSLLAGMSVAVAQTAMQP
jgi:hypothetical protein